jgi:protein O-GlcNAc transferase
MNNSESIKLAFEHYQAGNLQQAELLYTEILKIQPDNVHALYFLGVICYQLEKYDLSTVYFKQVIHLDPNNAGTYINLGDSLREKWELDEALASYQKALQLNPSLFEAYIHLGDTFYKKHQFDEAITYYQKALQFDQNDTYIYNVLGNALQEKGEISKAITCYKNALRLNPGYDKAYNNLGGALTESGQLDEAELCYRRAIQIRPKNSLAFQSLLNTMLYNSRHDVQTIFPEYLNFAKQFEKPLSFTISPHANKSDVIRTLKIGYVSPDFRRHAVSYFIEPVIIAHNRKHFEVFCYSNSLKHDEVTKRIQGYADQWRNIAGMSDEQAADLIRKDSIDILVDLAGHTANNRILLFARKPAPVQVSWIGYLATTGLSTMNYKIVDNYTDPVGKTEQFHTEKLLRLPECFLCYLPDRESPDVGSLPSLSTGHVTFGSFNNFIKMTSEVLKLWARILDKLPHSRLILKGTSFRDKTTCQYVKDMFIRRDIAAERITLQAFDPSPKHLESYNLIDIGLDTFPFNGLTTTCEAMWMGVPVVTLSGTTYASRGGVSLLSNVGLKDLIAKTHDEYISIAVNLAKDSKRLEWIRKHLRDIIKCSPLCDAEKFTANLETFYHKIWETWCKSV